MEWSAFQLVLEMGKPIAWPKKCEFDILLLLLPNFKLDKLRADKWWWVRAPLGEFTSEKVGSWFAWSIYILVEGALEEGECVCLEVAEEFSVVLYAVGNQRDWYIANFLPFVSKYGGKRGSYYIQLSGSSKGLEGCDVVAWGATDVLMGIGGLVASRIWEVILFSTSWSIWRAHKKLVKEHKRWSLLKILS